MIATFDANPSRAIVGRVNRDTAFIVLAFVASAAGVWLIATIMTGLIALLRAVGLHAYPGQLAQPRSTAVANRAAT